MPSAASAPLNIGTGWTRAPMASAPSPAAGQRPGADGERPAWQQVAEQALNRLVDALSMPCSR
jgi:hypothetical protein